MVKSSGEADVEMGEGTFEMWLESDDESTLSSFESTNYEEEDPCTKTATAPRSKSDREYETKIDITNNEEEWTEYIKAESKHLIKKCKRASRRASWWSSFFTFVNDITEIYLLFFSTVTFVISSIAPGNDIGNYILVGLAAIAAILGGARALFKPKKRSIYFKQSSIQYKRIYRKLTKYRYTTSINKLADFMSVAYDDVDKLAMNDRQANFNNFKSQATGFVRHRSSK